MAKTLLVTGVAGFIGSHFFRSALEAGYRVVGLDKLTYCANRTRAQQIANDFADRATFVVGDVADTILVASLFEKYRFDTIVHFAAQTHVDRSIIDPKAFVEENVVAVQAFLQTAKSYWETLDGEAKEAFRFVHISTDEVFGDLTDQDKPFTLDSPMFPNSPYAASKAGGELLVRSYFKTYKMPCVIVRPSNTFGPGQYPEKLIPKMIERALTGATLPVYGSGKNSREWLYVKDLCQALLRVLEVARAGEAFNIGGGSERTTISVVRAICELLDEVAPKQGSYVRQLEWVADRLGHDWRYAMDATAAMARLGQYRVTSFSEGLRKTVLAEMKRLQEEGTLKCK